MKKLIFLLLPVLFACTQKPKVFLHGPQPLKGKLYGDSVYDDKIKNVENMESLMRKNAEMKMKVKGIVGSVCKNKGCWLTLKLSDGKQMRVTFKDYGFFVPQDIVNKEVVLDGEARVEEISVNEQQHFAEDAHKSKEEIAKITTPEKHLSFEATGVVVL